MDCDYPDALNLGTEEMVTINELVDIVASVAGKRISKIHNLNGPQGVRGRNSDNRLLRSILGWEPSISLGKGLELTFPWIDEELRKAGRKEMAKAVAGRR